MSDLTVIENEGLFASCIRDYFIQEAPEVIIETGLYHGTGSTSLITGLIRKLDMTKSKFYSIECNANNIEIAKENLSKSGLIDYVEINHGLSIPKDLLPSSEEIKKIILEGKENGMVKLDHEQDPENGHNYYEKETASFPEDNLLGKLFQQHPLRIEFILLDSGGHIGFIEFLHVISLLKHNCCIALDDTKHLKHYRSLEVMKSDKRFNIIHDNDEKFGSAIAIFKP